MTKSNEPSRRARGGCLCGAVRYEVWGSLRDVINCHCSQCLHTHGHFSAYTAALREDVHMITDHGLKWFSSSVYARRGFCSDCGASVFWEPFESDTISIAAGTVDRPTGLTTIRHVYAADAGDYYAIADDLERLPSGTPPHHVPT